MCHHHHRHKNSPPPVSMKPKTRSSTTKKKRKPTTTSVSLKPARKTRTKRRKPKYLSLNSKLNPQKNPQSSKKKIKMHQQLTLFPLHPEHLVEDGKDDMHEHEHEDNNVVASFLFDTATDTSTTLNGLLTSTTSGQESPAVSPLSLTFAYSEDQGQGGDSNGLVRTAMRCKQRDASEEKWVSYNEVVENKIKEEEVMSSSCIDDHDYDDNQKCELN